MPTVRDVSRQARCSPATVSRAINNTAPVSAEVRRNVLEAMRDLGYAPRPQRPRNGNGGNGATTRGTPSGVVSVVLYRRATIERVSIRDGGLRLNDLGHVPPQGMLSKALRLSVDFYMHIISGVVEELSRQGVEASLRIVDDLRAADLLHELAQPDRCGTVLLGEHGGAIESFVAARATPLVLVDILHASWPDVVTTDNDAGIGAAVDHLTALGHQRIGFVGAAPNPAFRERREAFEHRVVTLGLPSRATWRYEGAPQIEETADGLAAMLRDADRPSAIVCANDYMAMGVLRAAARRNLRVPQDLSVVGFDDVDAAALVDPPLTTVRVPMLELGRRAARQLLQTAALGTLDKESAGCTLRLRPTLVPRSSTASPAPATKI